MAEIKYLDLDGLKALYGVVDGKITTAVNGLKNGATTGYDTLKGLEDKIKDEATRADAAEKANAAAITKLNGADTVEGSVAKSIKDAIDAVVDGAPEAFDTLKEISVWIAEDKTGTTTLIGRVTANEDAITKLNGADTVEGSVAKSIKDAIESLDSTKGEAEVATGKHVAVQVVETNGIIAAVNVNENDIASAATLADVKSKQEANTTTIANAIDEDAKKITLGTKSLQLVAFTVQEIQDAAKPATGN